MTNDSKSSEEIEREIERERAGLKDSIDNLQDRFSFDGVFQQVGEQFREHGGEFGRSVAQSARDNPMALALTGVGVAWMIFGNNRADERRRARIDTPRNPDTTRMPRDAADYSARPRPVYSGPKPAARPPVQPSWARDWDRDELGSHESSSPSLGERASDTGASIKDAADSATDRIASASSSTAQSVSSGAASTRDAASDAARNMRDTASSAAHSISDSASSAAKDVRDTAGNVWSSASQRANALQRRLTEGTENLSEEARERIAAARARAFDARDAAARRVSRRADQVSDLYEDHPLAIGALAFAVGAAIAGALPRTRLEDEYVGEYSDDLYDEAERIYAEEVEKAQKVFEAGFDETVDAVSDLKDDAMSAADSAVTKAKSAATRVADATQEKADQEHLGDIGDDLKKDS
ncbi:DUF3618 domain-containing protein [Thioclava indica]|uniref:DUF3618 domain-containing protein n=1 Tax=Thioclava indica TaxID=1353528 RepID=A0A074JVJ5_9RHOB|nr:DUF3618 domain-containing protein [Thioclava indica]KEO61696.1 hypothetical protein DT23_01620 [Thioclava indica]